MRPIRASEIGEYLYCRRAWWLRHVQGHESANTEELAHGLEHHAQHGRLVLLSAGLRVLALLLMGIALVWALYSFWGW